MDTVEDQVRCLALASGLRIEPEYQAEVVHFFTRFLALSALVAEFPIPPPTQPAPVFPP